MEFSTGSRKRKKFPPQYRETRAKGSDNKRNSSHTVLKDFEQAFKTPPRPLPTSVTVIDDEPEQVAGQQETVGTDTHKLPWQYKATGKFRIPKKSSQSSTAPASYSNSTAPASYSNSTAPASYSNSTAPASYSNSTAPASYSNNSQSTSSVMPPKADFISLINKASKTLNPPSSTTNQLSQNKPVKRPVTRVFRNSMESSLPPPPKRKWSRTKCSPSAASQTTTDPDKVIASFWDDTCLGLEDPNTSFTDKLEVAEKRQGTQKSISPDIDDERVSNASSESGPLSLIDFMKSTVRSKKSTLKKKPCFETMSKDVLTIESDDEMSPPQAKTQSPPKIPPPNLLTTARELIDTVQRLSPASRLAEASRQASQNVNPQTKCLPAKKPEDILSILDSPSPSLSKEDFTFDPKLMAKPIERQKQRAPEQIRQPPVTKPSYFYGSKDSASDCSFTSSSITGRGIGVPRLNKRPIRQETTAGRVLATHGATKSLKLKRPSPRLRPTVDDEEGAVLPIKTLRVGSLELNTVLHAELRSDGLCVKLDCNGLTETLRILLKQCMAWQLHLGNEPYLVCISMKIFDGKAIADNLLKKYPLEGNFYDPMSHDSMKQCIVFSFEEKPTTELIRAIFKCLDNKKLLIVDKNLSTEEARQLMGPHLNHTHHGNTHSPPRMRRSSRRRGPPVRVNPSESPLTLDQSPPRITKPDKPNKRLLTYNVPAGSRVNIEVSTHDVDTLIPGEYLNDKVVDFYLRYMWFERLAESVRSKVHIFSSFFHTRLKDTSRDNQEYKDLLTPEKQHSRVKTWTRRVDLFDKEYIILPVCHRSHWFVVFVYKAGLFDPVSEQLLREARKKKKKTAAKQTKLSKHYNTLVPYAHSSDEDGRSNNQIDTEDKKDCIDVDKDSLRAASLENTSSPGNNNGAQEDPTSMKEDEIQPIEDGVMRIDDSLEEMLPEREELPGEYLPPGEELPGEYPPPGEELPGEYPPPGEELQGEYPPPGEEGAEELTPERVQIGDSSAEDESNLVETRPCVLVLDSLGVRRTAVVKTVRSYLTVEWREKKVKEGVAELDFDLLPAEYPQIPLQNNSSDCGVFMLQYVESLLMRIEAGLSYPETREGWGSYKKIGAKRREIEGLIMKLSQDNTG